MIFNRRLGAVSFDYIYYYRLKDKKSSDYRNIIVYDIINHPYLYFIGFKQLQNKLRVFL